jgi:hypothetical protein
VTTTATVAGCTTSGAGPRGYVGRLLDAVAYLLDGVAAYVETAGDDPWEDLTEALLVVAAEAGCQAHDLPRGLAPHLLRRAGHQVARANGYQPADLDDPLIDKAIDDLLSYPRERQVRLLRYAARQPAYPRPPHFAAGGPHHPAGAACGPAVTHEPHPHGGPMRSQASAHRPRPTT